MNQPGYNANFFPPAPVVPVVFVVLPHEAKSAEVSALLDTGADVTIVPKRLLQSVGARPLDFLRIRSYIGEQRSVRSYAVDVIVNGITLPGIEIIGDDVPEPLRGRDVLNRLRIVLDGPPQKIEVRA